MKRILLAVLLILLVSSASFIYFFNINHYSQWISAQIEKHSGYQVRFDLIELEDWRNPQVTISGIEITHQNKAIITLQKVHIASREFDVWNRYLDIALVDLQGVNILVDEETLAQTVKPINAIENKEKTPSISELLPWKHLLIDKVNISGVNGEIDYQDKYLQIGGLNATFSDLLIIADNQFSYQWQEGSYQLAIKEGKLILQDHQSVEFNDVILESELDLLNLQAQLLFAMKKVLINTADFSNLVIDNSVLQLQLDNNKLIVQHLVSDVFSGQLQLQGMVLFTLKPFSKNKILVDKVALSSLLMKDMQIDIPAFASPQDSESSVNQEASWPINDFQIEKANLENINISSREQTIPLFLKGANVHIRDVNVLDSNSLINFMGSVNISFTYLQWEDVIIEAFQGKLGELPFSSQLIP